MGKKLIIAICAGLVAFSTVLQAESPKCFIFSYEGRVSVLRQNKAILAALDMPLAQNDVVKVDRESTVDITMNGLVGMRFFESPEIKLKNVSASGTVVSFDAGSVVLNLKPLDSGSTFELETPVATAIVTGTQFSCQIQKDAEGNMTATFAVRKGSVDIYSKAADATVKLIDDQIIAIGSATSVPAVRFATEEELKFAGQANTIYVPGTSE